ncbi:protein FAM78A isoform X2 [Rhinoderma darwinii]|uniref:protein FAM78A isoform X2 n=1 Tax=Rhinoderma darwinii TaxID=43563 RepID=UPI003F6666CC
MEEGDPALPAGRDLIFFSEDHLFQNFQDQSIKKSGKRNRIIVWKFLTSIRSSWELPDLENGKIPAISDSDGINYPWYGNTTETCTVIGPTKRDAKFTVSMNDNFYPSVTWAVPVSDSNVPMLTGIQRDQSFTTWLVAINMASGDLVILHTIKWRMKLKIEVTPTLPLGQRAKLQEPFAQEQPQVLDKNEPIPQSGLVKPNANDAQVLMWRPKNKPSAVVIPPKRR